SRRAAMEDAPVACTGAGGAKENPASGKTKDPPNFKKARPLPHFGAPPLVQLIIAAGLCRSFFLARLVAPEPPHEGADSWHSQTALPLGLYHVIPRTDPGRRVTPRF